jgi:hypothetical protein
MIPLIGRFTGNAKTGAALAVLPVMQKPVPQRPSRTVMQKPVPA